MASDDPIEMVSIAVSMAELLKGKNAITSPWWAIGASVEALAQLAAEDGPLSDPARVAMQILASVYNDKMGRR